MRHRFVNELFAGAVPDAVVARYLIQDHRFLDSFLTLLGATLASADTELSNEIRSQPPPFAPKLPDRKPGDAGTRSFSVLYFGSDIERSREAGPAPRETFICL